MSIDLALSAYPGRGVLVGIGVDRRPFWAYFVTGRSVASRRRLLKVASATVTVEPIDDDARPDDLRHYTCVQATDRFVVVGNGTHVSRIAERMEGGDSFERAYDDLAPEPDLPIFTPRIAAAHGAGETWMGTVWRGESHDAREIQRIELAPGAGCLLATYDGDSLTPRAARRIQRVTGVAAPSACVGELWARLDMRYRVGVAGGYFDRAPAIEATVGFDGCHGDGADDGGRAR
jgi:IMP cyclohydrolase